MTEQAGPNVAPGSVVVRDEEWLVAAIERTMDGRLLRCHGLSGLVRLGFGAGRGNDDWATQIHQPALWQLPGAGAAAR